MWHSCAQLRQLSGCRRTVCVRAWYLYGCACVHTHLGTLQVCLCTCVFCFRGRLSCTCNRNGLHFNVQVQLYMPWCKYYHCPNGVGTYVCVDALLLSIFGLWKVNEL